MPLPLMSSSAPMTGFNIYLTEIREFVKVSLSFNFTPSSSVVVFAVFYLH